VPNEAGYARFRAAGGVRVAAVFVSASESHNRRNVNRGIAEHLEGLARVAELARADGVPLRAYVSTVCGCPYEGKVAPGAVVDLVRRLRALGAAEISLGDTIGVGHPAQVRELVAAVAQEAPLDAVALHLHDTFGRALANVQAGYEAGVRTFDSALGGLGGCPYAPGASGNVATEDVVALFEAAGVRTGVDLEALVDATAWLEREVLRRALPGRVYRARLGARARGEAAAARAPSPR
jgi:hydroxymethylglutaryl-CoA lyase